MANLQLGLLGCGSIAQIAHLEAIRKADNVDFVALCDAAEDLGQEIGARHHVPKLYTDHEKFLADPAVEAVLIPVAHAFHAPLAIAALAAGKHVLVEKPLAVTIEECEQIVAAVERTGLQLQMACMKRYDPGLQFAHQFVHEQLDGIIAVAGWYCDSQFHGRYVQSLRGGRFASQGQLRPSGAAPDAHLNNLLGHGVHLIDTVRFLADDEITAVTTTHSFQDGDLVSMSLLEFAQGARGTFQLTVKTDMDWFEGYHVHGQGGSVVAQTFFPYTNRGSDVKVFDAKCNEYRSPAMPDSDPYERQLEAFADAVLSGKPVSPNATDGLIDQKILYAMHRSAETGSRQTVD